MTALSFPSSATRRCPRAKTHALHRARRGFVLVSSLLTALAPVACGGTLEEPPTDGSGGATGGGQGGTGGLSTTGGTGGSAAPTTCDALCVPARTACPSYPLADCLAYCANIKAQLSGACLPLGEDYLRCLTRTGASAFTCQPDGSAVPRGSACSTEAIALTSCALSD